MLEFSVSVADTGIRKALEELQRKTGNIRPLLEQIGGLYAENTKLRFKAKQSPEGKQWPRNTLLTRTLKERGFGRRGPGIEGGYSMGVWTGELSRSISYKVQGNNISVGVFALSKAIKYAGTFHFGAKKGSFGGSRRGKGKKFMPIPWNDIPPRPFLGFNKTTNEKVLKLIKDHLTQT